MRMESKDRSTEWALLFPLKAGFFAMRSSMSSKSVHKEREKLLKEKHIQSRNRIRRGSSLSDLDKLQGKETLPDIVRSAEKGFESVPHSPALSRTNLQLTNQVRGSIGDLMNLKKYGGSNWSVRSETLIAKTVPLSTVTPKQSPPAEEPEDDFSEMIRVTAEEYEDDGEPLTCAQRTQRLSRLIKRQRETLVLTPTTLSKNLVSKKKDEIALTSCNFSKKRKGNKYKRKGF